jgi:hypothetical protein
VINEKLQAYLIALGLLDPPADGKWGTQSHAALKHFQELKGLPVTGEVNETCLELLSKTPPSVFKLDGSLASRVVGYMAKQGYCISQGDRRFNIVYLEGCDQDGIPNADRLNEWNDRRLVIEIIGNVPRIVGNWLATTEPGKFYTQNPLNPLGAFRIKFGQYRAWSVGSHGRTQYPALVQSGPVTGYRDANKDGLRTGDVVVTGDYYGINQHHGWDMAFVDESSAGCLVGQSIEGHWAFMELVKSDRRYQANPSYVFYTTVLDATKL